MKWRRLTVTVAVFVALVGACRAEPSRAEAKPGDTYELSLTRDMSEEDNHGGRGSSHEQYGLIERVIQVRADGLEYEYDLPLDASPQKRARDPHFPARVFKPAVGPTQLLNRGELEARIEDWLRSGGMTRVNCGQLVFTWNAFRIDCDPHSVIGMIQRFDLSSFKAREGASYQDPKARGPALMTTGPLGPTLVAQMTVDPDAVRTGRAATDVDVAQLMGKSLTFEEALRERASDEISGTISVTFWTSPAGDVNRRTTVTRLEVRRPDGRLETQTITETLDRRKVS